jgi:hypothetical protein
METLTRKQMGLTNSRIKLIIAQFTKYEPIYIAIDTAKNITFEVQKGDKQLLLCRKYDTLHTNNEIIFSVNYKWEKFDSAPLTKNKIIDIRVYSGGYILLKTEEEGRRIFKPNSDGSYSLVN